MAYSYYRVGTIDHTQVGSSDLVDFPVKLSGTFSWLATVANGGRVQSPSGFDIVVAADAAGATVFNFERVVYTTSGEVEFHFKVPVSHTVDTLVYILYGNASVTTDQSNAAGTWTSDYKAVYHLQVDATDSTGNNNGTVVTSASQPTFGAQQIEKGASKSATNNSGYIDLGLMANVFDGANTVLAISMWAKPSNIGSAPAGYVVGEKTAGAGPRYYVLVGDTSTHIQFVYATTSATTSYNQVTSSATTFVNGTWRHLVFVMDVANHSNSKMYVDGASVAVTTTVVGSPFTTLNAPFDHITLFREQTSYFQGAEDEVRFRIGAPGDDWVLAEYNNQKSGSTFLTIGPETTTTARTQPGVAEIVVQGARTQSGVANVKETTNRTTSALARTQETAQRTSTSVARVGASGSRGLAALARVAESVVRAAAALARIQATVQRAQSALARITGTASQDQSGTASIFFAISERGGIDYDQIRGPARHGPGSQFQMHGGGSTQAGHAAVYDSTGDTGDAGAPPALVVTAPTSHTDGGIPGQVAYDGSGNYYWCYAADSWARVGPGGWSNSF